MVLMISSMGVLYDQKICMVFGFALAVLFVVGDCSRNDLSQGQYSSSTTFIQEHAFSKNHLAPINRRLLASLAPVSKLDYDDYGDGDGGDIGGDIGGGPSGDDGMVNRIGRQCSKENIHITQGQTPPLPNGIPTYTVLVQNICLSGSCSISDVHLSCGWFSSARLINPSIFRRLAYNDCLVNNGNPINPGETIDFQYANTYPYPMVVSYMSCS